MILLSYSIHQYIKTQRLKGWCMIIETEQNK